MSRALGTAIRSALGEGDERGSGPRVPLYPFLRINVVLVSLGLTNQRRTGLPPIAIAGDYKNKHRGAPAQPMEVHVTRCEA